MNSNLIRVLLVEDNEDDYVVARDLLAEAQFSQFELEWVTTYDAAIAAIARQQHDVYLFDYRLGDRNGIELLQQALVNGCKAPIILLTGSSTHAIDPEAMEFGATDFLCKDEITTGILERTIRYAIRQQQLYQQVKHQAQQEQALNQIVQAIRQSLDLDTVFATATAEIAHLLQLKRAEILQYFPEQQLWRGVSNYYQADLQNTLELESDVGDEFTAQLKELKAIQIEASCIYKQAICETLSQIYPGSWLLLPIKVNSTVWGSLNLVKDDQSASWQNWEVKIATAIAEQLAIAIQQSELYKQLQTANDELQRLAKTDSLTKLANRRYFDEFLNREWKRSAREQSSLALILCDIDYFKKFNDTYGHLAGDFCLTQIAQAFQRVVKRSADLVARYGGEEFAIVLTNTSETGAIAVAQFILDEVRNLQITHTDSTVANHVTVSLGIAATISSRNSLPEELITAADQALYQAKDQGRNTYVIAASLL